MITVRADPTRAIKLGRQGENLAVQVLFDLSSFAKNYPGGTATLLVQRRRDTEAYPVTLQIDGATACWSVSNIDTDQQGLGNCELQWRVGETLAKSVLYVTWVDTALEAGESPPDTPSKAWFDSIQSQIGNLADLSTSAKRNLVAAINEAARSGGGGGMPYELGTTLKVVDGVLDVNTSDAPEQDNTQPITSAAVYSTVGNIEALLSTI
nr:MAG TPA: hypothetical protein [Caudoviricetes sp.]